MTTTENTALEPVLEPTPKALAAIFMDEENFNRFYDRVAEEVALPEDATVDTKEGRELIASAAYKVARVKTTVDGKRKELNEEAQAHIKKVNAAGKKYEQRLQALQDSIKEPLDRWKEEDKLRQDEAQRLIDRLTNAKLVAMEEAAEAIGVRLEKLRAFPITEAMFTPERVLEAEVLKKAAIEALEAAHAKALEREAKDAELLKLRAEAEARQRQDDARAAAEKAKADEEARQKAEAERIETARREEQEKAAREAQDALERQQRDAELARLQQEEAHQAELQRVKAEADAREAARMEQERLDRENIAREEAARAAEAKRLDDERKAREADQAHRKTVEGEALHDMLFACGGAIDTPMAVAMVLEAILTGHIRHTKVTF